MEVACWPQEKAERRYAGVSHIDAERVNQDDAYAEHIVEYAKKSGVEISALAYYPNVMVADKEKSATAVEHLKQVILASKKLGVGMVTTFIGRDQTKNIQENLELVKEIWPPIIKLAEECDVKIAIAVKNIDAGSIFMVLFFISDDTFKNRFALLGCFNHTHATFILIIKGSVQGNKPLVIGEIGRAHV